MAQGVSSDQVQSTDPRPAITLPAAAAAVQRLNPTGRDIALTGPLRDEDFVLGDIGFILRADDTVLVESSRLVELLRPIITSEAHAALQAALPQSGNVPAQSVTALGFPLAYDPTGISLTVQIPADRRVARNILLQELDETPEGQIDAAAGFSGYINFNGFVDYEWQGEGSGFDGPIIFLDSALRLSGVVLENEGSLDVGGRRLFSREGTRLVYDDRNWLVRWTAGDLIPISRGFSGAPQLAGVGVTRLYGILEPDRSVQPRGRSSFTLTRPGNVDVLINGQPVRSIRLQPGTYNLTDFPFVQGTNDVSLVVEDDGGRREILNFSTFFDRTLLAPGLTEFGLFAGIRNPTVSGGREYNFDEPGASGFIRRGITDSVTLGGNFNVQRRGAVVGAEAVIATAFGTLGGDLAVSQVDGFGLGYALNADYRHQWGNREKLTSVLLGVEHRSDNFVTPDAFAANDRYAFSILASVSQGLGRGQQLNLSGEYRMGRDEFKDEYSARAAYSSQLTNRLSFNVEGLYERRAYFGEQLGLRALLVYRLSPRSIATAEIDTRFERGRVAYQTSGGRGVGSWSAAGGLEYVSDEVAGSGSASYLANRAELGVSHRAGYDLSGTDIVSQRTSVRFGTALAFADGSLALSRPIEDSFVMVKPYRSLDGAAVYIDPRDEHYTARSGFFGPAVEPNLQSYSERVVSFDVPEAPTGFDLGQGNVRVYPPYRSGYLVTAGSEYSVTVVGTLLDENNQPVSLLAGELFEVAHPDRRPLQIFTNRNGRFGISGLRPGRWRMMMPSSPPSEVIIVVPEGEEGIVRLGDVRLGDRQ